MVTRPSWLLPENRPVWRPYVVAGMPSQANSVRVTSVIFMGSSPSMAGIAPARIACRAQPTPSGGARKGCYTRGVTARRAWLLLVVLVLAVIAAQRLADGAY